MSTRVRPVAAPSGALSRAPAARAPYGGGDAADGARRSKAALNMLTVLMHRELSGDGFTVLSLDPGWNRTDN
jgi:NAD(P)-dependent dehydrogenase (short-subunit alcohol dehydrogenase family)